MIEMGTLVINKIKSDHYFIKKEDLFNLIDNWETISTRDNHISKDDKIYFPFNIKFPRYKSKIIFDEIGAKKVNKISKANTIIYENNLFPDFLKKYSDNLYSFVSKIKVDFEEIFTYDSCSTNDNYVKFYLDNVFVNNFEKYKYIIENQSKFKFVDLIELQSEINSTSKVTIDYDLIESIMNLLESKNNNDFKFGIEMLTNLPLKECPITIHYIVSKYYYKIRNNNNVNIKSLLQLLSKYLNSSFKFIGSLKSNIVSPSLLCLYYLKYKNIKLSDIDKNFLSTQAEKELKENLKLKIKLSIENE